MKITHVKVCNYRNLRNIDIGLAETVAIIGENNSGKSNFLKAITLPFLTDDNTHISKKLSWSDINNETKKCYYNRNLLGDLYRENPVKSRNYEAVKSSKKLENVGNSYIIPALLLYRYSYI